MSNTVIQLKYSAATGNTPTALANGELAINTYDGKIFYRGGVSNTIQSITRYTGPAGLDTELQFNDAGSLGGSEKLTFNKTTGLLTVNGTVRANIFSDDGVDLYGFSNNAFNTANAAFAAANNATSGNLDQVARDTANAAFITANNATSGSLDQVARNTANASFARANNSLNVQSGGTITGDLTINGNLTANTISGEILPRVISIADGTSVTINVDTTDIATQNNTQVAGTLTINAPTGTSFNGQKLIIRLQSANVQTFSWNGVFAGSTDLSLPTTSSGSSKYDYVGFIYNTPAVKWQLLAKNFGF